MTTQIAPIVGPQAQKSIIIIGKASVKKQLLSAEFTEQLDLETKPREFQMQGRELVHPHLETALHLLVPHFCLLTEQLDEHNDYTASGGYWPTEENEGNTPQFDNYGVTGLIIGVKDGVTLVGFRKLGNGKVLNMTSQYVSFADVPEEFEESDAWHYRHTEALKQAVEYVLDEVDAALRGKCSDVGRQLGMFEEPREMELGEAPETQTAPPKAPGKKAKAKLAAKIDTRAEKPAKVSRKPKQEPTVEQPQADDQPASISVAP